MSSSGQIRTMLASMSYGQPVEVTNYWGSVKKLSRLAALGERFGYQYMDVVFTMQGLKMLLVPDPDPQARARAQQAWAQHPQGGPLPALPVEVPELLRTRIRFDMYAGHNEKRRLAAVPVAFVIVGLQMVRLPDMAVFWGALLGCALAVAGASYLLRRKWRRECGERLRALGYVPLTEPNGRVRLVPPGSPYAQPQPQPHMYGQPQPQMYGQPQPQAYGQAQPYGQSYAPPQQQAPYAPPQGQPHGQPQQPYGLPQQPQQPYQPPQ
ncbi:hypothetical protein [Streptomyces indicus]|uniref:Integral membrane protein n=1 Tax=Streptomyces indicus TaxID=417292 RepID=A0A1G8ZU46_9ACTN|nr:hypothetical protein [Streptomyces indicus]SDK18588.1 hypothetical protein SAMN05421806_105194 [Streptomyces indicus]